MKRSHLLVPMLCFAAAFAFAQDSPQSERPPAATQDAPHAETSPAATAPAPATLSSDQIKNLIRQAAEKDIENDKKQRDYTYSERVEEHKLDGKGDVKSTEVRVYDVLEIYGEQVRRLVAKDNKPLSEKDANKEEEKIQKVIDKRKNESDSDRAKRLKREDKDREDTRAFVKEVADAYDFTFVGTETFDGRDTYVIDAEPRPGFEPTTKEGKILPKFRFRLWLDKTENQWVKLDAVCIETVSVALAMLRVHKGSRILVETTRVNDEVWLPKHIAVHFDAKLALLKNIDLDQDVSYKDYKKFHAQTKIVGMEEVKQ